MDIIDKIIGKVEKTTRIVKDKSVDVFETTKLKISITTAQNDADLLVREIGGLVYDAYKNGSGNAELVEQKCKELEQIKRDIEDKKNQFASLRNLKRCVECECENKADALYCNKCGAKLSDTIGCEVDDMPDGSEKSEGVVIDAEELKTDE